MTYHGLVIIKTFIPLRPFQLKKKKEEAGCKSKSNVQRVLCTM